jgi:hypothetical protein
MSRSLCEKVAVPVLDLHRRTSSPVGTAVLAAAGAGLACTGLVADNHHLAWLGGLVVVIAWYGFLLHGCDRLLAAKDAGLASQQERTAPRG